MKYIRTCQGIFIKRLNRFAAEVSINGETVTVHVKNTGRLRELLTDGSPVTLAEAENPERKTGYDLVSVYKETLGWVNVDSMAPNAVVREWLAAQKDITLIHPEYTHGNSRVDFYAEKGDRKLLIEVKGCTLVRNGIGYFPDAPTERGVKHLKELTGAVKDGYECVIAFVLGVQGINEVRPNTDAQPEFTAALYEAERAGVKILCLPCRVTPDEIYITR